MFISHSDNNMKCHLDNKLTFPVCLCSFPKTGYQLSADVSGEFHVHPGRDQHILETHVTTHGISHIHLKFIPYSIISEMQTVFLFTGILLLTSQYWLC